METPIKPGKYKCAAGQEAHILPAPPELGDLDCLVGWVLVKETKKWAVMTWTLNGRLYPKALSQYDISSPWIDAPIFNHWDKVPWAKALYKYSRSWILSSFIPEWDDKCEDWYHPKQNSPFTYRITCHLIPEHSPHWVGWDKDSLILRPANV